MPHRYALRRAHPGMWNAYDVFTGQPATVEDRIMMAMDMQDADEVAELLNLQDARMRAKLDVTGLDTSIAFGPGE
ncbi:hypothetical protein OOJ09_31530 [Mesorhizobium qingshengii]|uniref:Uncharacterized protein n=1 Tax=Mesorhizobium qingshengii TaxID=1165689 RepID=A0ABT4R501_9HYPH|nr:hypothetical protein [Mesorhizobium qingshengii]MCZ8548709.1 hypothetical protein [Mesorhizobium qingshengii]